MTISREVKRQNIETRLRILRIAGDLMMEKGIKETSLKDIAREAGMSAGTLYYYYSAKEDIIYDIAENSLKQITEGLLNWIERVDASTPREQILKTVFESILAAQTRGKLHLYLVSDAGTVNSALTQKYKEQYENWRKTLVFGLKKVLRTETEAVEALAYMILATIDGLIIQSMFSDRRLPLDEIARLIAEACPY